MSFFQMSPNSSYSGQMAENTAILSLDRLILNEHQRKQSSMEVEMSWCEGVSRLRG